MALDTEIPVKFVDNTNRNPNETYSVYFVGTHLGQGRWAGPGLSAQDARETAHSAAQMGYQVQIDPD